ncbi:thermonuclease family protein [Pseudaestuariivita rosea]|uniref:thermonuclease family protein n=1 Tax=Pseudaestuariivita rosea TaxID=2763263 RepID=UPI001ABA55E9|nr:thermonuclease family protein [Pseudaestuariivita rosea]
MEALIGIFAIFLIIWLIYSISDKKPSQKISEHFDKNTERQGLERQRPTTSGVEHDPPPPIPTSHRLKGRAWVIDGDTIVIGNIKVRLAGLDAPELDQPWGQKSKWAMVNLCKGQIIRCELTGETSYDRLVGTCYLADGTDIGAELIKQGLALDGGHFSKGKYRHLEPQGIRKRLKYYGRWR